jgi:hypothetical protein
MTGGLMQLVAYGAQDIYLTGNPMITYFKVVYRRHTNFAMESIPQTFNALADFGSKVTTLISRTGDLISGACLQTTLPAVTGTDSAGDYQRWTDNVGHYLINDVAMEIGGQLIDKQYGDWLEIWAQLSVPAGQMIGYREMIGQDPRNPLGMNTGLQRDLRGTIASRTIFVPLQFWFCRNIGLSLPLISLQYHEVKIHINISTFSDMFVNRAATNSAGTAITSVSLSDTTLWIDYIYLDTDERRRFAQVSHEYLIEQVQFSGDQSVVSGTTEVDIILDFNHPVKELIWVSRFNNATANQTNQWSNYTTGPAPTNGLNTATGIMGNLVDLGNVSLDNHINIINASVPDNINVLTNAIHTRPYLSANQTATARLYLNGHERFKVRDGTYFNWVQCRDHHTNIPESPGINVYSFALQPEDHQPSGTCNFSRIDTAKIVLTLAAGTDFNVDGLITFSDSDRVIKVFATNYNVLRIMSGMGGLAYSN